MKRMTAKMILAVIVSILLLCGCAAKELVKGYEFEGEQKGQYVFSSDIGTLKWRESWRGGTIALDGSDIITFKGKTGQVNLPDGREMTVTLDKSDKVKQVSVRPKIEVCEEDHTFIGELAAIHSTSLSKAKSTSAKNAVWMLVFLALGGFFLLFTTKLTAMITSRRFVSEKYEKNLALILRIVGVILVLIPVLFLIFTAGKLR